MKAVISYKGKAFQKEVDKNLFVGKKIHEKVSGNAIADMAGYEFEICGGSDKDGFPMRTGVQGSVRKKLLVADGAGYNAKGPGIRRRKGIHGEVVSERIAQVNLKVLKEGAKKFDEFIPKKEAGAEGEKKEEKK